MTSFCTILYKVLHKLIPSDFTKTVKVLDSKLCQFFCWLRQSEWLKKNPILSREFFSANGEERTFNVFLSKVFVNDEFHFGS